MPLHPPEPEPSRAATLAARFAARAAEEGIADVAYATIDSPLGRLVAAGTRRGLVRLAYEDFNGGVDGVLDGLARAVSPRIVEAPARLDEARRELDEYFAGRRTDFELAIDWSSSARGSPGECCRPPQRSPSGARARIARWPSARARHGGFRAAGNALGHNMIPIVVPCHRVLASGGGIGGYTGGLARKEHLLRVEGVLL